MLFHFYTDICSILDISYQSLPVSMLQDYVGGGLDQEATAALVAECGWSLREEEGVATVFIRSQEANIRPKKILAKIEFESEWVWLAVYRTIPPNKGQAGATTA